MLERAGRSTDELAALSKLPIGRIEKILDGSYVRITITDMDVIASALGTPLYSLLAPMETSNGAAELEIGKVPAPKSAGDPK